MTTWHLPHRRRVGTTPTWRTPSGNWSSRCCRRQPLAVERSTRVGITWRTLPARWGIAWRSTPDALGINASPAWSAFARRLSVEHVPPLVRVTW